MIGQWWVLIPPWPKAYIHFTEFFLESGKKCSIKAIIKMGSSIIKVIEYLTSDLGSNPSRGGAFLLPLHLLENFLRVKSIGTKIPRPCSYFTYYYLVQMILTYLLRLLSMVYLA